MTVSSLKLEIHWKLKRLFKEAVQNLNWYLMSELNHRILYPFWPIYRSQSWGISASGAHSWRDCFSKQFLGHLGCDRVLRISHGRLPCDSWGTSLRYLLPPDRNVSSILLRESFRNKRSDANAKRKRGDVVRGSKPGRLLKGFSAGSSLYSHFTLTPPGGGGGGKLARVVYGRLRAVTRLLRSISHCVSYFLRVNLLHVASEIMLGTQVVQCL